VILGSRFLFWVRESEKRVKREVRRKG